MEWQPSTPLSAEELAKLPVFPLPRVVFFPGTALPLHLFEPRYTEMIEDCLDGGCTAMAVALLAPGWEEHYDGNPEIYEIAGAGRIVAHQRQADGTHDVILHGLDRVRLHELPNEGHAYRCARAEPIEDFGTASSSDVLAMMACATRVAAKVRERQPDFALQVSADLAPRTRRRRRRGSARRQPRGAAADPRGQRRQRTRRPRDGVGRNPAGAAP